MKAAYIKETGPAENIQVGELPTPQPQGSEVLVKVTAAALNPIDTYLRNGANYWELPMPFVVGCDLAGVVEQVGPEAKKFKVGDRVWGSNQGLLGRQGTFAEYASVEECWLYATPDDVSDDDAVACALVGITAHLGLVRDAKLKEGESIFVHGGTGGVGSMVVQMAKALGARVITTGGSDEKVQKCLELGADAAVNYKTENVADAVKKFAPDGVNVVWETLREPDFETLTGMLAERGRLVLMAGRDARPPFPVGPFYVKGCSLHGFVMFKASPEEQQQSADNINQWLSSGKLKANISKVLPLDEAAQSHKLQEDNTLHQEGSIAGKILVKP